ncbi:MAG: hypothetical protein AB7T07_15245 [Steroidobacteraceae bacterium]
MTHLSTELTPNQKVLAHAKATMTQLPKPDAGPSVVICLKEAIDDARSRLKTMEMDGKHGSVRYVALQSSCERWEMAWRMNR